MNELILIDYYPMEKRHLFACMQVFISVADSGSFSESARRLGLSQPSVSRQINHLEAYLGVRLLQRTTRQLSLTEAGQIYYEKAKKIQHDVLDAEQSIAGFKETPSGILKIAAPFTWTDIIITPYMGEFLKKYPDITLDIECNDHFQDVVEDRLDLVIRVGTLVDSSYIAVPLANVRMVLCATANYLAQYGTPKIPADLQYHHCIVYETFNQWLFTKHQHEQLMQVSGPVTTNAVTVMLSAVQQHLGLTVLPDVLINKLLHQGVLVEVMPAQSIAIKNLPINQLFALYSNRKYLPAKVRAFIDFYREKFFKNQQALT